MIVNETSKKTVYTLDDYVAFFDAAEKGSIKEIQRMLDNGIGPDTVGPRGWTALMKAAAYNRGEVALELLKRGAEVDSMNYMNRTALMVACKKGHYDMVLLLLFYGANPLLTDVQGKNSLMFAAEGGQTNVVGLIIDRFPELDLMLCDRSGRNALDIAIFNGHLNAAKIVESASALQYLKNRSENAVASFAG